jgi:hypothetical protein
MAFLSNQSVGRLATLWGASTFLACSALACEEREVPSEIRLEIPSVIASRDVVAVSVQATNAQGVRKLVTDGADYALSPADLGSVSKAGMLTCERSGDGQVSASIAGVSRSVAVRCRIVDRIEAANVGRVELSAGAFSPKVRALDKAGAELSDVEVTFFSKNSGVAYPKDGQLVPKSVGTANLVARAGEASAEFKVDVVRKVVVEALPIEQNKKLYFSLEPAKYELKITLPSPHRVSAEWRGAPFCNATSEGEEHVWVCGLRAKGGGVAFDNPAYLKDGSKTPSVDGVELYEVP